MTFYWNTDLTDLTDESQIKIRMNPLNLCHLCSKKAKLIFCYVLRKNSNQLFSIECVFQLHFKQKRHFEMHPFILRKTFIRYYVKFNDNLLTQEFENEIQSIIKYRKSMGIEEAIIQEITEQVTEKVTRRVTKRVTEKVTEKVTEQVTEQVRIQTKISGIQKALERNKLTLIEISEDFEVSLEFIMKVKSGEIK